MHPPLPPPIHFEVLVKESISATYSLATASTHRVAPPMAANGKLFPIPWYILVAWFCRCTLLKSATRCVFFSKKRGNSSFFAKKNFTWLWTRQEFTYPNQSNSRLSTQRLALSHWMLCCFCDILDFPKRNSRDFHLKDLGKSDQCFQCVSNIPP